MASMRSCPWWPAGWARLPSSGPGLNWRSTICAVRGTIFSAIVFAAIAVALSPIGMPALTAPFVLAPWVFLLLQPASKHCSGLSRRGAKPELTRARSMLRTFASGRGQLRGVRPMIET